MKLFKILFFLLFLFSCIYCKQNAEVNTTRPMEYHIDYSKIRVIAVLPSNEKRQIDIYGIFSLCYNCLPQVLAYNISSEVPVYLAIPGTFTYTLQVRTHQQTPINVHTLNNGTLSSYSYEYGDRGVYTVVFNGTNQWLPSMNVDLDPIPPSPPLIIAFSIGFGAILLYVLSYKYIYTRYFANRQYSPINEAFEPEEQTNKPKISNRVESLDAWRGMSLAIMIFVNYGGGEYWFFNHSTWNGLTVADLVFPWFIWIMGTSMALSFKNASKEPIFKLFIKIIRRSIILFALGLLLNDGYNLEHWRILGVLQRFSIAFLVVGFTVLIPKSKAEVLSNPNFLDLFPYYLQWLVMLALLFIYFAITFLLDVPGCGKGYLGPGGIGDFGQYTHCTGGAAGYIDLQIFGINHIYQNPTCKSVYLTGPYDPEGLLGNLTSIFLCYMGFQAGRILVFYNDSFQRMIRWLLWGVSFAAIGTLLCQAEQDGGWIPINKNLWSPSFIFVMGGTGFLGFSLFYFLIDHWKVWNGSPFRFLGMNSIMIYCCHEIFHYYFPFSYKHENTHAAYLTCDLIGVIFWFVVAFRMYQLNFFVTI